MFRLIQRAVDYHGGWEEILNGLAFLLLLLLCAWGMPLLVIVHEIVRP